MLLSSAPAVSFVVFVVILAGVFLLRNGKNKAWRITTSERSLFQTTSSSNASLVLPSRSQRVATAFTNTRVPPPLQLQLPLQPPLSLPTTTTTPKNGSLSVAAALRRRRFDALQQQYNLTRSRKGKAAISDAVNFLLDQEDNKVRPASSRAAKYVSPNPQEKCASAEACPVCKVTMNAILHEGSFEYLGDGATPPYDDHCWSARIRYHTAPACQAEEDNRGVVPIYKWRWTLASAKKGYCVMPDTSPPKVAAAYYDRVPTARKGAAQRNLTILMLGLSFMGEPFMSMGCLYDKLIVGGRVSGEKMDEDLKYDVLKVKRNGGICSGYPQSKMASFYPPALHVGDKNGMPKQNIEACSMDHAYVVYGGGADAPSVKVRLGPPGNATSSSAGPHFQAHQSPSQVRLGPLGNASSAWRVTHNIKSG